MLWLPVLNDSVGGPFQKVICAGDIQGLVQWGHG